MERPLRIGLYSPFFGSTYGGGEKYLAVTAETLRDAFPGSRVEIVGPVPADRAEYERRLNVNLGGIGLVSTMGRVTPLHRLLNRVRFLRLYRDLVVSAGSVRFTRGYDLFLSMVYVLPAFTRARKSVILCQFPYERGSQVMRKWGLLAPLYALYRLPYVLLRPLLVGDDVDDFDKVVCQSEFVRHWVREYWHRESDVVNPPIDLPEGEPDLDAKRRVILSVGRFFEGGHSKRHDLLATAFRELCDAGLEGWELHLAGSLHADQRAYFERVQRLAEGYPIRVRPDLTHAELEALYAEAAIYWHAAGFGVDESLKPIEREHFGMTTVEAMGHGAVPVVIAAGGQLEVIEDGVSGFHWHTLEELKRRTLELIGDGGLRRRMALAARERSRRYSRAEFKRRMADVLRPLVESAAADSG